MNLKKLQYNKRFDIALKQRKNGYLIDQLDKEKLKELCDKITPPAYKHSIFVFDNKIEYYTNKKSCITYEQKGKLLYQRKQLYNNCDSETEVYEIFL